MDCAAFVDVGREKRLGSARRQHLLRSRSKPLECDGGDRRWRCRSRRITAQAPGAPARRRRGCQPVRRGRTASPSVPSNTSVAIMASARSRTDGLGGANVRPGTPRSAGRADRSLPAQRDPGVPATPRCWCLQRRRWGWRSRSPRRTRARSTAGEPRPSRLADLAWPEICIPSS